MIYKMTFGQPEKLTPSAFKPESKAAVLPGDGTLLGRDIVFRRTARGCTLQYVLDADEEIFGLGLQLKGFRHRGTKKLLRNNSDPVKNTGDSHAPVPFFVTNKGYGLYVDTARHALFYCGTQPRNSAAARFDPALQDNPELLYADKGPRSDDHMLIEIPAAKGVDVYLFTGDTVTDIVAQYNLLSGGGCMPPLWGLGMFYRCYLKYDSKGIRNIADTFRKDGLPLDIIGLEPGWQTHAYSCTHVWDPARFPDYPEMVKDLADKHMHVSVWQHAFMHPTHPLHDRMLPMSGDYRVWEGLVPDFAQKEARELYAVQQKKVLTDVGVDGFKLDECDGSDYTGSWSFPTATQFPSGLDGEQMNILFGMLYQQAMLPTLGNKRTLSEVRSGCAFCSSYPFVLYSDLYDHADFIRGLATAGLSGLLWTPEVRHADSKEELIRRLESVIFSPQALINGWYIDGLPWDRYEDAKEEIKALFELRMKILPYLYAAFYRYYTEGVAPIRPLVSDYSNDANTYDKDDCYLFGNDLLVAPLLTGQTEHKVYLPGGRWYDFFTGEAYEAGEHTVTSDRILVFAKEGSLIPVAEPLQYVTGDTVFDITLQAYGKGGTCTLIVDDGMTNDTAYEVLTLDENGVMPDNLRYILKGVKAIGI